MILVYAGHHHSDAKGSVERGVHMHVPTPPDLAGATIGVMVHDPGLCGSSSFRIWLALPSG
jgi:hypothetical protein